MSSAFYPPARPLSVGEVLDLAFQIFKATLVKGLPYGICAVVAQQLPNIYALSTGATLRQTLGAGEPVGIGVFVLGVLLALTAWSALLLRQRAIIEHRPTSFQSELGDALRRLPSFAVATVLFFVLVGGPFALLIAGAATVPWWGACSARGVEPLPGDSAVVRSGRRCCLRGRGRSELCARAFTSCGETGGGWPSSTSLVVPW